MENNTITCIVDMFMAEQTVTLPGGHQEKITLDEMNTYLPRVCFAMNIPKIHLFGNEKFCTGLANSINLEMQKTEYSNFEVEIEVN
mgnify:CR=1 FL=1